jgi:capsular exopolysaccharide synthesis family protein
LDQRRNLQVLLRRKVLVGGLAVAFAAGSYLFSSSRPPQYEAKADVLLARPVAEQLIVSPVQAAADPKRNVATQLGLLKSRAVKEAVRGSLGEAPAVRAEAVSDTDLIRVAVRARDPKRAAKAANTYVDAYLQLLRSKETTDLDGFKSRLRQIVDGYQGQISAVDAAEASPGQPPDEVQRRMQQRAALIDEQSEARQLLDKVTAAEALGPAAQRVGGAGAPATPAGPRPAQALILGGLFGLLLGVGVAFLLEAFDDSVKGLDDLAGAAPGLPVLGQIPTFPVPKKDGSAMLVTSQRPASPAAEAFRSLRMELQFSELHRLPAVVEVTSPGPGEGKTTIAANLALALEGAGLRVVLVETNLRSPSLAKLLDLSSDTGLVSVLNGSASVADALQRPGNPGSLAVLPAGPLPPRSEDLFSSNGTKEILDDLLSQADVVVLDGPPVLPISDAVVMGRAVDVILMAVSVGHTSRRRLCRSVETLQHLRGPIGGIVLNRTSPRRSFA